MRVTETETAVLQAKPRGPIVDWDEDWFQIGVKWGKSAFGPEDRPFFLPFDPSDYPDLEEVREFFARYPELVHRLCKNGLHLVTPENTVVLSKGDRKFKACLECTRATNRRRYERRKTAACAYGRDYYRRHRQERLTYVKGYRARKKREKEDSSFTPLH